MIKSGEYINQLYLLKPDITDINFQKTITSLSHLYGSRIWIATNNGTILLDSDLNNSLSGIKFSTEYPNIKKKP